MKKRVLGMLLCITMAASLTVGCGAKKEKAVEGVREEMAGETAVETASMDQRRVYVTADWVKSVMDGNQPESENYVILEVSYGATAADSPSYKEGHIPGAIHASIMEVEDATGDEAGAYNLLAVEEIRDNALSHGITRDTTVILYAGDGDAAGVARQAYAYLYLGVENVKILNGSLAAWNAAGYELETEENKGTPADDFGVAVPVHPEYWLSIEDAKNRLEKEENFKLVSIRTKEEWLGETSGYNYMDKAGEPKGAVWGKGCDTAFDVNGFCKEDGTVKELDELLASEWEEVDFTLDQQLAFYCGTGWRAAVPFLILYQEGYDNISLYDGGWYQWIMKEDYPVQVGDPSGDSCEYMTVRELPEDKAAK
ncbi:sulfurtransferase [Acetivibrio ethanolgignens]|uniref:Rhodanese domain-containing protein n=1 Tax=Acetivibrio ethanolgignens TaxID=290052 RepID=A0A0V8QBK5_9FIRM|nr:rhodanese-like domain-containing protein [Acetivibrio ethanolgignens]KSV57806.1 hypothetical protein ASU35_15010 [Acetivibrio ethanolgignens]